MGTEVITLLDYSKYVELLEASTLRKCLLVIYDTSGNQLWVSDNKLFDTVGSSAFRYISEIKKSGATRMQSFDYQSKATVYCMPINSTITSHIGYLSVTLQTSLAQIDIPNQQALVKQINFVCNAITSENDLNYELNTMALELTDRYEELNLVYHTDDQVVDSSGIAAALKKLITNCCDFLDVDAAVLYLPDHKIELFKMSNSDMGDMQFSWEQAQEVIYLYLREQRKYWVLNKTETTQAKASEIEKYKVAVTPVMGVSDQVVGLLAILRNNDKADFDNSDIKLIDVMSKKSSKIIQMNYDSLTGLINRAGFEERIKSAILLAKHGHVSHSLIVIEVSQLDIINDTHGKEKGDELLCNMAEFIKVELREKDTVSRMGGHKFGLLLMSCDILNAKNIAQKLYDSLTSWRYGHLNISLNIGLLPIDSETENPTKLLNAADLACEAAHETGTTHLQVYDTDDAGLKMRKEQMKWFGKIKEALAEDRFVLFGQAIVPLNNGQPHYEILLRYRDDNNELVSPFAFMPAAERYQMMPEIDRWVLQHTLEMLAKERINENFSNTIWGINLSGQTFTNISFIDFLQQQLDCSIVPAQQICFEITETAAISNFETAKDLIAKIRRLGCHFALDDFGSGLSSFGYLKNLPVDYLKIDGSLVTGIGDDPVSYTMVDAIHRIGRVMKLETIAEFVKDQTILTNLQKIGVDYAQGYEVGMPMPLENILTQLQKKSA